MARRAWKGISYANVVSTLALFVALGGVSYAAIKLPANSVGARQLRRNAVDGAKVKDGSLTGADIGGGLPAGATGPAGAVGPAGANGVDGAVGPKGTDGAAGTNGTDGAQGPSGVVSTHGFSGSIGTITGTGTGATDWQFVGGTNAVTITSNQRITATAAFALGAQATTVTVLSDVCERPLGGDPTPIGNHMTTTVPASSRQVLAGTATFSPGVAGFYTIGACVALGNGQTLDNNNNTDGWFIVTN